MKNTIKFFKPEDFQYNSVVFKDSLYIKIGYAANTANDKLEREGKIVYGVIDQADEALGFGTSPLKLSSHTALLIQIEEIPSSPQMQAENIVYSLTRYFDINPNDQTMKNAIEYIKTRFLEIK